MKFKWSFFKSLSVIFWLLCFFQVAQANAPGNITQKAPSYDYFDLASLALKKTTQLSPFMNATREAGFEFVLFGDSSRDLLKYVVQLSDQLGGIQKAKAWLEAQTGISIFDWHHLGQSLEYFVSPLESIKKLNAEREERKKSGLEFESEDEILFGSDEERDRRQFFQHQANQRIHWREYFRNDLQIIFPRLSDPQIESNFFINRNHNYIRPKDLHPLSNLPISTEGYHLVSDDDSTVATKEEALDVIINGPSSNSQKNIWSSSQTHLRRLFDAIHYLRVSTEFKIRPTPAMKKNIAELIQEAGTAGKRQLIEAFKYADTVAAETDQRYHFIEGGALFFSSTRIPLGKNPRSPTKGLEPDDDRPIEYHPPQSSKQDLVEAEDLFFEMERFLVEGGPQARQDLADIGLLAIIDPAGFNNDRLDQITARGRRVYADQLGHSQITEHWSRMLTGTDDNQTASFLIRKMEAFAWTLRPESSSSDLQMTKSLFQNLFTRLYKVHFVFLRFVIDSRDWSQVEGSNASEAKKVLRNEILRSLQYSPLKVSEAVSEFKLWRGETHLPDPLLNILHSAWLPQRNDEDGRSYLSANDIATAYKIMKELDCPDPKLIQTMMREISGNGFSYINVEGFTKWIDRLLALHKDSKEEILRTIAEEIMKNNLPEMIQSQLIDFLISRNYETENFRKYAAHRNATIIKERKARSLTNFLDKNQDSATRIQAFNDLQDAGIWNEEIQRTVLDLAADEKYSGKKGWDKLLDALTAHKIRDSRVVETAQILLRDPQWNPEDVRSGAIAIARANSRQSKKTSAAKYLIMTGDYQESDAIAFCEFLGSCQDHWTVSDPEKVSAEQRKPLNIIEALSTLERGQKFPERVRSFVDKMSDSVHGDISAKATALKALIAKCAGL